MRVMRQNPATRCAIWLVACNGLAMPCRHNGRSAMPGNPGGAKRYLQTGDAALMALIIEIRQGKSLKLPDAIVMACAATHQATVLTHDVQLLKLGASDERFSAVPF